jgi:hypothetical protein
MGTYVNAEIVYGVTITEPEWDIDAEYDPDAEEAEPIDYYEFLRPFPLLDYTYAGDSQWDENPDIVYVAASEVSVGEGSVEPFDPAALPPPDAAALNQLREALALIPSDKRVSEPGWLLCWNRG